MSICWKPFVHLVEPILRTQVQGNNVLESILLCNLINSIDAILLSLGNGKDLVQDILSCRSNVPCGQSKDPSCFAMISKNRIYQKMNCLNGGSWPKRAHIVTPASRISQSPSLHPWAVKRSQQSPPPGERRRRGAIVHG